MEELELINVMDEFDNYTFKSQKLEMEENRLINYHIVAVHNDKIRKPKQLYKFPWENDGPKFSIEEIKENIKLLGVPKPKK